MSRTHSLLRDAGAKIGRPKDKGRPKARKFRQRLGAVMSGGSMTANHVEHGIATFPGTALDF